MRQAVLVVGHVFLLGDVFHTVLLFIPLHRRAS